MRLRPYNLVLVGVLAVLSACTTAIHETTTHREVPTPQQLAPRDGQFFYHKPRELTLRWQSVPDARYDIEIDCEHCRVAGRWDSDTGVPWKTVSGLQQPRYRFTFAGDNPGRWRVRAVRGNRAGPWSPWWHFRFRASRASGAKTGH
jgi:hypothetical protein